MEAQKRLLICYGLFLILYAFTRACFLYTEYWLGYFWVNTILENYSDPYYFWILVAYAVGTGSLTPILYVLEKDMVPTKGVFTIIGISICGFAVVSLFGLIPKEVAQYVIYAGLLAIIFVILGLYVYVIQKTEGSMRNRAIWVLIGLIVLIVGMALEMAIADALTPGGGLVGHIRIVIAAALMGVGAIIFTWSQFKEI